MTCDFIRIRDIAAFEKALDALGVSKHERRGIERSQCFNGIPVLVSPDVPKDKAILVKNGEPHVWDLPKVRG